ncbi:MAG TPA: proline racemase family protein [Gemmatimonadaceae bacterium]|nr:proline racemase family protein [Gemmatimonadaceae bacterium]
MIIPDIRVVDSHTEGEPTRVVVEGWPALEATTMAARRDELRAMHDHLRRAVVCEPRGHAAVVGALLTEPVTPGSTAGIVFFNNRTYLGMCGHGLIGVVRTLQYLGRVSPGVATFDTPVGTVRTELADDGCVTIENVASRCLKLDVAVDVPGVGRVTGDIAYGGNWFFLTDQNLGDISLANAPALTRVTQEIQDALDRQGISRAEGAQIDHIELSGPPSRLDADSRNFVLCSGGEYDRSPCGTGTSAKMAVLHARGKLKFGQDWRQESVTGSLFTGWLTQGKTGELIPHIRGTAYVTAEATLRFDPEDPFRLGLEPA